MSVTPTVVAAPTRRSLYQLIPLHCLGKEGDVLIVCQSKHFQQRSYSSQVAFEASSVKLSAASDFFFGMFDVAKKEEDGQSVISVDERADIVALVLSATFQVPHVHKANGMGWCDLNRALRLAAKWQLERGRLLIFTYMLGSISLGTLHKAPSQSYDLVEIFAEALREGDRSLVVLINLLKLHHERSKVVLLLQPIELSQHHFMELGSKGCSLLADSIVDLVSAGVLKRDESLHSELLPVVEAEEKDDEKR